MSKEPSPVDWPSAGRPPEDPDGLLRAFFRAEMPDPWPGFRRLPGPTAVLGTNGTAPGRPRPREAAPPSRPALRSRLALAAAALLLLLGTLAGSGRFHPGMLEGPDPHAGRATLTIPRDVIMKEMLIQEVDEQPGPDGRPVRQEQPTKYQIDFYRP
jgi:hypothetical protein